MKHFLTLVLTVLSFSIQAQDSKNVELLAHVTFNEELNDIWGYTAPDGTEYALVGSHSGTYIFDLSDPANPVQRAFLPGPSSIWRDIKVWGHYAYVSNESADGLLIIDLASLPDSVRTKRWSGSGNVNFTSAHNVFVDEKGYLFVIGANYKNGGAIIADVHTDPWNPVVVTVYDQGYCHDIFVRGDTLWGAEIYNGYFSVVDISDKSLPEIPASKVLATHLTPNQFTHNLWVSDDNSTIVTTDEVSDGKLAAYDVSDLSNIEELDIYQANPGSASIPHNAFYDHDFVVISWYRDGVRIVDAGKPSTLVETGYYDTSPLSGNGFNGMWGVYPYFQSGIYVASDIENGFFVFRPTLIRAAYLEGIVRDDNQNLLNNVRITLTGPQNEQEFTDGFGFYSTGVADTGVYTVKFSKAGYQSRTIQNVVLRSGQTTTLNVELTALNQYVVSGRVLQYGIGTPVPFAKVKAINEESTFETQADAHGDFTFNAIYEDTFTFYAARWGFRENDGMSLIINSSSANPQIVLKKGYYDDFFFDLDWTVSGDATTGIWERAKPIGTMFGNTLFNPDQDDFDDIGEMAYVTGNGGGSAGSDDVDNGYTLLTSPFIDVSDYNEPLLKFKKWYMAAGSGTVNDSLKVFISNGSKRVLVDLTAPDDGAPFWNPVSVIISEHWNINDSFQVEVQASDFDPGHLIEAGLDVFEIIEGSGTSPQAYFKMDTLRGCAPFSFHPTDSSSGQIDQWIWIVEGNSSDTFYGHSPEIVISVAGVYDLTLIVTNAFGESTYSAENIIEVFESPELEVKSIPAHSGKNDGMAIVVASGGKAPYSYLWNDPAGQDSDTARNLAPGTYVVTVSDAQGCSSSDTVEVTISTSIRSIESGLVISPNPFHNKLIISGNESIDRIEVLDANGKQISFKFHTDTRMIILDSEAPSGLYCIRVETKDGQSQTWKVIRH